MTETLNPAQRRAVETTGGAVAVVAGAGSGKTRVLTHRYVRLVLEEGVEPAEILALTFTEKAALEMRERIRAAFIAAGERRRARAIAAAPVSTIHGLCARLLREHALGVGLDPAFTVVETWRAAEWMHQALGKVVADRRAHRTESLAAIRSLGLLDKREDFLKFHAALRAAGADPSTIAWAAADERVDAGAAMARLAALAREAAALDGLADDQRAALDDWFRALEGWEDAFARNPLRLCALLAAQPDRIKLNRGKRGNNGTLKALQQAGREAVAALVERLAESRAPAFREWVRDFEDAYAAIKRSRSALDFSDLEHFARDLLARDPAVRASLGVRHLLVDEYQDTNPIQEEILAALEPPEGRFAVGDPQQAIYGFRHADVRIMESFVEGLGEDGRVALDRNYRSRPEVLDFVNWLLAPGEGSRFRPLEAHVERAGDGPRVHVAFARAPTAAEAREREAAWIAREIRSLLERGVGVGDVAVLLRSRGAADLYERVLRDRGVDAHVERGGGVLATQEAAELAALLRALDRPEDALALAIVLRSPLCGIGDASLHALADAARSEAFGRERPDRLDLLEGEERARLAEWLAWWRPLAARAGRARPLDLVAGALAASEYRARLAWAPDGEERLANVADFVDVLERYDPGPGLRDAVELIDRLRLGERPDGAAPSGSGRARVRIQTIHSAKGLEFPVVFVADLAHRDPNAVADFLFEPPASFAFALPNPYAKALGAPGARAVPRSYDAVKDSRRARGDAEDERLLYVALTRARERLYLSAAVRGRKWTGWASGHLQRIALDAERPREVREIPGTASSYTFERLEEEVAAPPTLSAARPDPTPDASARAWARGALDGLARPLPTARSANETVTATEILAFFECPRRYFFEHGLGLRAPGAPAVGKAGDGDDGRFAPGADELGAEEATAVAGAAALGVAAHAVLEAWDPRVDASPQRRVDAVCDAHGVRGRSVRDDLARWVRGFYETNLGAEVLAASEVHRELPFVSRVGGAILRGSVDLAWIDRDGLPVIVDFKTTVADAARRAAVADAYAMQVALYASALEAAGLGRARRGYLYYLRDAAVAAVDLSTDALARAEGRIRALVDAQRAGAFPARAGGACVGCPARARCSAAV